MHYFLKTLIYIDVLIAAGLIIFRWALTSRYCSIVSAKIAVIALTTPVVALLSGNAVFYFSYLTLLVAFNSRSRLELAGIFLFLISSTPLLDFPAQVHGVYLFTLSALVAMGMGALIGTFATKRPVTRSIMRYDVAIWFLVGLFMFIADREPNATNALRILSFNVLTIAAPYILLSRAARNIADVERLLLRWSLGALVMAITACFQASRHWVLFEAYNQALHVPILATSASTAIRAGLLRTGGSMVDYSAGGMFLATVVTALPLLRRAFRPAGFVVIFAILFIGLFVTQSRGAWVGAALGLAFTAAWRGQWGRLMLIAGGVILANAATTLLAPSSRFAQLLGRTGHGEETASYRRDLLTQGIEQVKAYPLFGQSSERLVYKLSDLTQGQHIVDFVNSHLFIAMTTGIPVFLIWCAIWIAPIISSWKRRNSANMLAAVPAAIIVPSLVALTFTSLIDRNLTWQIIALSLTPACFTAGRRTAI